MTVRRTVVVVGPLPPPVHGMAKNTALVAEELCKRCSVWVADISPGALKKSTRYHVKKLLKVFRAMAVLVRRSSPRSPRLYIPTDAGFGMYYTIAIVGLARLLGYSVFIHHRSFAYIDKPAERMSILTRLAGHKTVHVFLCPDMARRFRNHYPAAKHEMLVSNARHIEPVAKLPKYSGKLLRLGHLSNLGPEKGLDDVLESLRRSLRDNVPVRLVLAGPAVSEKVSRQIEGAKAEFGSALDYRGPVYEAAKEQFYRDIDIFLFPTRYVNEAQPNVLLEAMSYGVPSMSYSRGCIAGDLSQGGGVSVPTTDDFVSIILPTLNHWARNRADLTVARSKALSRARNLRSAAEAEFKSFIIALTISEQAIDSNRRSHDP